LLYIPESLTPHYTQLLNNYCLNYWPCLKLNVRPHINMICVGLRLKTNFCLIILYNLSKKHTTLFVWPTKVQKEKIYQHFLLSLAFGSIVNGFESEHRLFSHHGASAFSKLRSLEKCSLNDSVRRLL